MGRGGHFPGILLNQDQVDINCRSVVKRARIDRSLRSIRWVRYSRAESSPVAAAARSASVQQLSLSVAPERLSTLQSQPRALLRSGNGASSVPPSVSTAGASRQPACLASVVSLKAPQTGRTDTEITSTAKMINTLCHLYLLGVGKLFNLLKFA